MNIDQGMITQALNSLSYPIGKKDLIKQAQQRNVPQQVVSMLERLPDKNFNSAQDIQNALSQTGVGNLFKR